MTLHPLVMVDIALFTVVDDELRVLLLRRANQPQQGTWALPGGILKPDLDRSLDHTARRVLLQKARTDVPVLRQVVTMSGADRDERGWSVSTLYYALVASDVIQAQAGAGDKAEAVEWRKASSTGKRLAFDHRKLLAAAVNALRQKVEQAALPLHLLPERFTLGQLQRTCEAILERPIDKSAFRRRLKGESSLVPIKGAFALGRQRPAQLFRTAEGYEF